jgi:hypothetical protein
VLSLTVGFFNVHEQFVSQPEVWGVITEVGCVMFGVPLLFVRDRRPTPGKLDAAARG